MFKDAEKDDAALTKLPSGHNKNKEITYIITTF